MIRGILLILLTFPGCCSFGQPDTIPYVILVSFDGFRYDYAEKYELPNFMELIREGSSAEAMIPSYPSKTFPNHYTLVTGLYPGNHGLVDNSFYDSVSDRTYTSHKRDLVEDPFYYGGLPLWQLAQQHGIPSASFFWVGSETDVAGEFPDHYRIYDESVPDRERIRTVLDWLNLPEPDRPHFISLYFSIIDDVTHTFGPEAPQSEKALMYADSLLGELRSSIRELEIPVNLIIVSDHGMYPMVRDEDTFLDISRLVSLPERGIRLVNNETHIHLYCDPDKREALFREAKRNEDHYRVFLREDTPPEWHYNANYRIGDILFVADPGYSFLRSKLKNSQYGTHGYDPYTTTEMHGIFYAAGPNIKRGLRIPPFENVHVYPLIAYILDLPIGNTDGSIEVLKLIVRE